ncbi:putative receptor protein kinase ZmPK1 [Neltuma alba]|uniref:putative receptor protein kinase ZmPK1 n=1 Tax=Neltuma alba TaxID=207710 RepID=UPI0010A485A3|nr:putative receptor protein kinase ZmPK1 [Prosopis alba]
MAFQMSSSLLIVLFVSALPLLCLSSSSNNLFSLFVENPEHVIKSRNGNFTAGFYDVGENAFVFAIWFTEPGGQNLTVIWMANRDVLVNGKGSTLTLRSNGNLVLNDAGQVDVWSTNTTSLTPPQFILKDDGNLILLEDPNHVVWQSFDFPTDTLVPGQRLTRHASLVSSKSQTNPSSGFHKLFFDNDNVLRLVYDGPKLSSIYWPPPWFQPWQVGRSAFNASRFVFLNLDGCNVHGICGENSFCKYEPFTGRTCLCLPGYKLKDESDSSLGCQPEFNLSCNPEDSGFLHIPNGDFYGYDQGTYLNVTFDECKKECLKLCNCKGFQYSHDGSQFKCYPKTLLVNGNLSPAFLGGFHVRLPISSSFTLQEPDIKCEIVKPIKLERVYVSRHDSVFVKVLLWLVLAIGVFELACIFLFWCLTWKKSSKKQPYDHLTGTGFRKYSYYELKEATRGFSEEIGRGAGGIVYKGVLKDGRVAAIKRLNEANQIESEFLAEVNLIGRLNHMNLIDMWGYSAEGRYRMLVYEYMENGSLAENLEPNKSLDWRKRYEIALGTARGLAYLHEECLEWVLHCDIKPQNILLGSDYKPKVADFGLSKLQNRNDLNNPSFSRIRGTRGYMAPEWVFNLPITSKVDVYSYGIVVLEMITGKSLRVDGPYHSHQGRLMTWVREEKNKGDGMVSWVERIVDPTVAGSFDMKTMEVLVTVALQCVVEDTDARPSMSRIVEILQSHEIECE